MILRKLAAGTGALALLLVLPILQAAASANSWSVVPAPSADEPFDAASITNTEGDNLIVWSRQADGRLQVFAELHPAEGVKLGRIMPVYKIDGGEAVDTDQIRAKGDLQNALWGLVNERASVWLLWTSDTPVVKRGEALHAWLSGRQLTVSIPVADGSTRQMVFPLAGSSAAIRKVTGITVE
ncbi:MAG: hypothetical protein ACOY3L_00140 [Pseudomonadota bacterium]